MKYTAENGSKSSARKISRRTLVGIVAAAVVLIVVATALSMQMVQKQTAVAESPREKMSPAAKPARRNYVTANAFGQAVVGDRQTGEFRPLTQDESVRLADGLKQMINQSTDDLVAVKQEDGTIAMDLQGHFQNVMLAKRESDGSFSEECVDNLQAAADFFEIDPKLVGLNTSRATARPSAPKAEDR